MDIGWNGTYYNKNNLQSVNNVLRNRKITPIYSLASPYMSQFLNLLNINTIYITSPDLGSYSTLGPRPGELTVVKKIAVSAKFGLTNNDVGALPFDVLDCSKQTLRTLRFRLTDVHGKIIPLNDQNVSFFHSIPDITIEIAIEYKIFYRTFFSNIIYIMQVVDIEPSNNEQKEKYIRPLPTEKKIKKT